LYEKILVNQIKVTGTVRMKSVVPKCARIYLGTVILAMLTNCLVLNRVLLGEHGELGNMFYFWKSDC